MTVSKKRGLKCCEIQMNILIKMKENKFNNIKNKRVLITGASGFIGYYLSELCEKNGALLYGIDRNKPRNENIWEDFSVNGVSDSSIKLCMEKNRFDIIFHLAGSASVPLSFESPFLDFNSLVPPTLSLLQGIKEFCPKAKLITFSSAAVYGNPIKLPILEEDIRNPISPYGIHKAINEDLIRYYCNLYEINCSVLRVFSAYGEGLRKQLFWDIMKKYNKDNSVIEVYGTGNETRDFIHVKDVVRLALLTSTKNFQEFYNVFNVASGIETSVKDCLDFLFINANPKPQIVFQGQNRAGNPINWRADVSKLEEIGYQSKHHIEKELANYFNWFFEKHE